MLSPRLRPIAMWVRGIRAPILYSLGHKRHSIPSAVTPAPLLVIAPHPDDETFACGGLIALKRKANIPVTIIFITDGGQSAVRTEADGTHLTARRKDEAAAACKILGVEPDRIHFLDAPDG